MPRLKIWNQKQIHHYERPPSFDAATRSSMLNLPGALQPTLETLQTVTNKVGFTLMAAYFRVRNRFFSPDQFIEADIDYLCSRLGVLALSFDAESYKGTNYARHRRLILDFFAIEPFQADRHSGLIDEVISEQLLSFEEPALILNFMLEWLGRRRIELPTYNMLQHLLTGAIRQRNQQVSQILESVLEPVHRQALDPLLNVDARLPEGHRNEYLLTRIRALSPADSPKQIRINLDKLALVDEMYAQIEPVLGHLHLNDKALRFFGEMVLNMQPFQIQRRKEADRYLLLIGFCAHQQRIFQDWMIDTLLGVVQYYLNRAMHAYQDELFANRRSYRQVLRQTVTVAQDQQQLLREIQSLLWRPDLSDHNRVAQLQNILPAPAEASVAPVDLEHVRQAYNLDGLDDFYHYLEDESLALQKRATPIVRQLAFDPDTSDPIFMKAIEYFQKKQGAVSASAPTDFLDDEDQQALTGKGKRQPFKVSLYKILLFRAVAIALKSGRLNLKHSYRYKALDDYLIAPAAWDARKEELLKQANLGHLRVLKPRLDQFRSQIKELFHQTNTQILGGSNPHFYLTQKQTSTSRARYHVKTPKITEQPQEAPLLPNEACIPLTQILATIHQVTDFLSAFRHRQPYYRKKRPDNRVFMAAITALGCNLGLPAMSKAALLTIDGKQSTASQLENTVHGYFSLENVERACNQILEFTAELDLARLRRSDPLTLHTASDGQKIKVASTDTIYATYSYKYFGKDKGVSAYSFLDERDLSIYSTLFNSADREAWYVLDGLLHNPLIVSTWHTTDTHGYTEVLFGLMDLLGFGFSPVIAKLYKQKLYSFKNDESRATYAGLGYHILPSGYIQTEQIGAHWDMILGLAVSLKLKYCTASQVFKRLNSYSRQHPLYAALKEYGRLPKTVHVLRYVDDVELRQLGRSRLNSIEHDNRFSKAVFFGNGGEMIFLTRPEQQLAEACKRLIKTAIVCWNYLYLTRQLQQIEDDQQRAGWLERIRSGSMTAWRHVYFNGFYDFSDDNLRDTFDLLTSSSYDLINQTEAP